MAALRGQLSEPSSGASVAVEGTISDASDIGAGGEFTFTDSDEVLQGILEGKPFRLTAEDGSAHDITISSVSPGPNPGTSVAVFSRA